MLKILLVKTSSMGDVIHALPSVTDIVAHFPAAQVDWVVEESFAELPALHPGVKKIIPVAVRRWRRNLLNAASWREMAAFRRTLQAANYDLVIDSQGLIKSAIIASLAHGPRCGYDRASAREPLAALAYDRTIGVARDLHAVERNRLLAGRALGYLPGGSVDYGIAAPALDLPWLPGGRYAVLLHATSRADKEWPEADWLALAARLNGQGLCCVLPWGSTREQARSARLAKQMAHAVVPPRLSLTQAAALLGAAEAVAGVDTGLTHLAAALKVPVVALYCASDPGLTGVYASGPAINLGRAGQMPRLDEVSAALDKVMQR
ncbi:MAG: lipopolysaccharide heptosyltransferase I [Nitrosomonadales bacterium]|nr:MAG: lipopolysaccharide heptosyltransferase I [Nitrosomonadales bacterium]